MELGGESDGRPDSGDSAVEVVGHGLVEVEDASLDDRLHTGDVIGRQIVA